MAVRMVFASISVAILGLFIVRFTSYGNFPQMRTLQEFIAVLGRSVVDQTGNVKFPLLDLATIDMTEAKMNSKEAALKVYKALNEVGFAYLVNIPGFEPDLLLKHTKWYFDLPLEVKMQMAKNSFRAGNKNAFRGYFPVIPGGHSFKEALEFGGFFDRTSTIRTAPGTDRPLMRDVVRETNVWPNSGNATADLEFKNYMTKTFYFYTDIAKQVSHLMAEGLGLSPDYFDYSFGPDQLTTLRLLHYPTRMSDSDLPGEAKDGDVRITTGEHFDSSFLTILATFENEGLQVKLKDDSPWLNIPTNKNGLVINIGALLSAMVDGKFKATNHRVIDLGRDRYSVPLFYEMHFDGDISKSLGGKTINPKLSKYGPWMTNRTSMFAEYATTDFGIAD